MPKQQKHILVIRLSAMGDVAMTIPVLRALTQQHPELTITMLTRKAFFPFFRDLASVNLFEADVKGRHKGAYGLFKLAKRLNENKFYAIVDLHNVLRSKVLKKFLKCRRFISIDKGRTEKRLLTSGKIFKQLKTTHQRYADVFNGLGYKIDLSNPTFPEKKVLNEKLISIVGGDISNLIGLAPFAAHNSKMYPLDLMEEVIKKLSEDYKIILFGGGIREKETLGEFESSYKNVINLAGKLSMNEELDIISNLDVMLSMDSGNAHIAAMLGVKVITIWGVTHPYAGFAPFNQSEDYALLADRKKYPKIPTSVYGNKFEEGYTQAAGTISPERVIEKIKSII